MLLDCPEAIAPKPFSSSPLHDMPWRCLAATFKYFTETIVSTTRVRKMLLFSRPAASEVRDRKKGFQARLEQKLLPLLFFFFAPMGICGRDKKALHFGVIMLLSPPSPLFLVRHGTAPPVCLLPPPHFKFRAKVRLPLSSGIPRVMAGILQQGERDSPTLDCKVELFLYCI